MTRSTDNSIFCGRALVRLGLLFTAAVGLSCGQAIELYVLIYDPCDGQAALEASDHIGFGVYDADDEELAYEVWDKIDDDGELPSIPLTEEASISVLGMQSDGSGTANPDAVVAAATVGFVDLSGADGEGVVQIDLFLGKVGEFHNTSAFDGDVRACSRSVDERWGHTATLLDDGRVFLVGGIRPVPQTGGTRTWWMSTEYYSPATGSFDSGPDLKWARRNHTATRLDDGRLLIVGGEYLSAEGEPGTPEVVQVSQVAQLIDFVEGTVDQTVMLTHQRTEHTATLMGDGTVLIIGGKGLWDAVLETTEIFDPTDDSVRLGPTLITGRANHAAVRVSATQVLAIGGQGAAGTLQSVEFVDVTLGTGFDCAPAGACDLSEPRSHVAAELVPNSGGVIAVAGGFFESVLSAHDGLGRDTIDLIHLNMALPQNSARLTCGTAGPPVLTDARGAAAVALLDDGLLIMGGTGLNARTIVASAEVLRITDVTAPGCGATSTPLTDTLSNPRAEAVVTPLMGGDLLISGGFSFSGTEEIAVGQAEIYTIHRR